MLSLDGAMLDFKYLDQLALGDTFVHRLDPRAKVLVALFFIILVVSFDRYELTALVPFFLFPVFIIASGDLPLMYILKKILIVIPFALIIGIFNPFIDKTVLFQIGSFGVSGGWISWASIVCRALLTVGTAIILLGVTGFPAICMALERMGMPQAFAVQLLFLYRYIFVLTDEGSRMSRARELRSFGKKGKGIKSYGSIIGSLLLRTWFRAERIHMAMLARGFNGQFHTRRQFRFGWKEAGFVLGWVTILTIMRFYNIPRLLGQLATGVIQ